MVTLEITIECHPDDVMPTLRELAGAAAIALRPALAAPATPLPAAVVITAEDPDHPPASTPDRTPEHGAGIIVDEPEPSRRRRAWQGLTDPR